MYRTEIREQGPGQGWSTEGYGVTTIVHEVETAHFPSVEELRESLVREKFHLEVEKWTGITLQVVGVATSLAGITGHSVLRSSSDVATLAGAWIFLGGRELLTKTEELKRPKVESRISAFHEKFPNLSPITFNPREYFSTFKAPLLKR